MSEKAIEIFSGDCLIMDDNEIFLKMLKKVLQKLGFHVDAVTNGTDAIVLYQKHSQDHPPYSFVILDVVVPEGLGGKEAAKEILKIDKEAKILISTGYSEDSIKRDFKSQGIMGFLQKPYTISQISNEINKIIRK